MSFIPSDLYTPLFYHVLLLLVLITWLHAYTHSGFTNNTKKFNITYGYVLLFFLLVYIGLRPNYEIFGDMGSYASMYDLGFSGNFFFKESDKGFYLLTVFLSFFSSKTLYFFIIALIYIGSIYWASKRLFPNYYYFSFLILVASFSFFAYGTNGIRNGIATSIMLLGLTFNNRKIIMYGLFFIAYSIHSSLLLPIAAFFLTTFIKNYYIYLLVWVSSIFVSLISGSFFENQILKLGSFDDDKMLAYFQNKEEIADIFSKTGFRWDFLLYSSIPVVISYYFIIKKDFKDAFYKQLTNIFLITNTVWILIIRASFSNRFAYLSWFMMGLIIIYPFLKQVYWRNQFQVIGMLTVLYFSFTYILNVFLT